MHPRPGTRRALPSTTLGMGQQFSSPKKRRDKRKTQTSVTIPGQSAKRQRLLQQLNDLFDHKSSSPPPSGTNSPPPEEDVADTLDGTQTIEHPADEPTPERDTRNYSAPSMAVGRLYDSWTTVIPTIIEPFLQYLTETIGKPLTSHDDPLFGCHATGTCELKRSSLLCLYFDRAFHISFLA